MFRILALALALVVALVAPASAADHNYAELFGNVVAMQETTVFNVYSQTSTLKSVTLSIRTDARGTETLTVNCPTAPTALRDLCRNNAAMLTGYCPTVVATSTCFPDPLTGNCELVRYEGCSSGVGKCVWAWGFLSAVGGEVGVRLDNMYTRTQSSCSPK